MERIKQWLQTLLKFLRQKSMGPESSIKESAKHRLQRLKADLHKHFSLK